MIDILLEVLVEMDNSDITKYCISKNPYETFEKADWNSIGACSSELRSAKYKIEQENIRDFLVKNPWYKGPNWSWETYSKYNCSKVNHLKAGRITVCSKPYYLKD